MGKAGIKWGPYPFILYWFFSKLNKDDSSERFKWKIVEPDENGKINCLDCSKSFSCMSTAKVHQYKCLQQTSQEAFLSPKKRPG